MITVNVENIESLLIWSILIRGNIKYHLNDVANIDVTTQELTQKAWKLIKGKRHVREYYDELNNLVVRFRCEYTLETNSNKITDVQTYIEFFDFEGNIGLTKKLEKELSRKYLTELNRTVRQNQIDYLVGAGNGFREDAESYPEPIKSQLISFADLVDAMWVRYDSEINKYIGVGDTSLATVVINESTEPFLTGMNSIDPETGLTMRQTILNQIT